MSDVHVKDIAWQVGRLDLGDLDPETLNTKPTTQLMPIWSAANAVLSEEDISLKRIAFLPVLPYPVTRYDVLYTALKNLQCILRSLDQTVIPVTCDEGVYRIAREIQLLRPDEFKNVVLCMGSFHMAKVALGCIGKYLKGSGAESILT